MALPVIAIVGAIALAEMIQQGWNVYSTDKTTKANDVQNRYLQEFYGAYGNESADYMRRYIRAHHLGGRQLRYPIRSGLTPNLGGLYGADAKLLANQYARSGSYVHGAMSIAKSVGYGRLAMGYAPVKSAQTTDAMYG